MLGRGVLLVIVGEGKGMLKEERGFIVTEFKSSTTELWRNKPDYQLIFQLELGTCRPILPVE